MNDVTLILQAIEQGDPQAAEQLLPLVYVELRKLAAARMAQEPPDHTLQATALVHEAYLRLVGNDSRRRWDSRGHFFAAAAEAMRRILVESARRRHAQKRGGDADRVRLHEIQSALPEDQFELLALDEALQKLEQIHPENARIVKLRFFAGCTLEETADMLGISRATVERKWAFARAWLFGQIVNV